MFKGESGLGGLRRDLSGTARLDGPRAGEFRFVACVAVVAMAKVAFRTFQ
jgi:hypothetical protein